MKTNRLFYLTISDKGITRVNKADVSRAKESVKNNTARYQLHAVYAPDAQSARQKVIQHKTEIYNKKLSGALSGAIRTCGAYFPTTDAKGRKIHRCLFYQPTCGAKKCKTDPKLSGITNPYQEEFPFLQFKKHPDGKYRAYYSGTNDLYEINNTPVKYEFNSPKEGYLIMLYKLKPELEALKHKKLIPEQPSFIEPSQIALFGISGNIFKKGDLVQQAYYYYTKPIPNKTGIITKIWDTPNGQWGIVYYGLNQSGQRMQNKYPLSVFTKVDKSTRKSLYDKYFPESKQMALFGKLSGFTATCRTFKRNSQGRKYCAQYAPTCGADAEGCLTKPVLVPGQEYIPLDSVVKQIAKDLAYEYNERLDGARELMRKVKQYGGIAPYGGSYLKEEYKDIPTKYKSAEGVKIDELASEIGFEDERSLVSAINSAEDEFNELKAMQGGAKIRRFKTDDFMNMAYNNLIEEHGHTFSGLVKEFPLITYKTSIQYRKHLRDLQNKVLEYLDDHYLSKYNLKFKTLPIAEYLKNYENMHISQDESAPTVQELRNFLLPYSENILLEFLKAHNLPGYNRLKTEFQNIKKGKLTQPKSIPESKEQIALFGYKGYDEEGAINATIKNIDKFQGKPAYIYATYTGIKSTHMKPPISQQHYRVNPDGSVDFIQYYKGTITEKRTRNPKYKTAESKKKEQTELFGIPYIESGKFTPDLTKGQIRARILNPKYFRSYFIRHSTTPGVQYAMGIHEKGNVLTQSIRFSKKLFNLNTAKAWFNENINRIIKRDMIQ
jgi:hypothetical protein